MIFPEIKLNGWQTIKDYATQHHKGNTQYVSRLIKQGKLPFKVYPELNNLKLVLPPKKN